MKKSFAIAATLCFGLIATAGNSTAANEKEDKKLTLAVYGDWPYSTDLLSKAPLLIGSINSDPDVSLVLHVGDIHSGSMLCTADWNQGIFNLFQQFEDPFVYTPGDNEWTDCHRPKEGNHDPLGELANVRALFFPRPGFTLGEKPKRVFSQSDLFPFGSPTDRQYVENVIWKDSQVVFVTLNLPGSNNDTVPWSAPFDTTAEKAAQAEEVANRTAADLHWLDIAFAAARLTRAKGVVIGIQADMWDPAALAGDGLNAYTPVVKKLADLCVQFGRPVLLINGDSHVFETDQPLADPSSATGLIHGTQAVPNLTRLTVEGSTLADEWVKLTVDPRSPGVFSWERIVYLP